MIAIINPGYTWAALLIAVLWAVLSKQRAFLGDLERRLAIALAVGIFLVGMLVYADIMHVGGMPIELLP